MMTIQQQTFRNITGRDEGTEVFKMNIHHDVIVDFAAGDS